MDWFFWVIIGVIGLAIVIAGIIITVDGRKRRQLEAEARPEIEPTEVEPPVVAPEELEPVGDEPVAVEPAPPIAERQAGKRRTGDADARPARPRWSGSP